MWHEQIALQRSVGFQATQVGQATQKKGEVESWKWFTKKKWQQKSHVAVDQRV